VAIPTPIMSLPLVPKIMLKALEFRMQHAPLLLGRKFSLPENRVQNTVL
jgi:hypothetical protein